MSDFDPRFDPAFQPGYDPSKHGSPRSRSLPERQTQQTADAYAPAIGAPPRASEPQPSGAALGALPIVESEPASFPSPAPSRNPLLITLWVISALLVVAGLYGLRLIADRVSDLAANGNFGGSDYYLLQSYTIIAPLLIVLGLTTAIATLFFVAARRP
jgi:hypothetical protein